MSKHARQNEIRRFRKFEYGNGRWCGVSTFTLQEFINANKHDEFVIEELVPQLLALKTRESFVHYGGAAGNDKSLRIW